MKGIGGAERGPAGSQQQTFRLDMNCRREIEPLHHT